MERVVVEDLREFAGLAVYLSCACATAFETVAVRLD